jgi:hypothetical protein
MNFLSGVTPPTVLAHGPLACRAAAAAADLKEGAIQRREARRTDPASGRWVVFEAHDTLETSLRTDIDVRRVIVVIWDA